jgi:hypothetical protein
LGPVAIIASVAAAIVLASRASRLNVLRRFSTSKSEEYAAPLFMTPSLQRGGRFLALSDNDRVPFPGILSIDLLVSRREVVSEGVGRRRDASRVPQMCPECVRVFSAQTTLRCQFAGTLGKPSDGLEPSTPSLPSMSRGNWSQPVATVLA